MAPISLHSLLWGAGLCLLHEVLSGRALHPFILALCRKDDDSCSCIHITIPNWHGTTIPNQVFSLPLMPTPSTLDGYFEDFMIWCQWFSHRRECCPWCELFVWSTLHQLLCSICTSFYGWHSSQYCKGELPGYCTCSCILGGSRVSLGESLFCCWGTHQCLRTAVKPFSYHSFHSDSPCVCVPPTVCARPLLALWRSWYASICKSYPVDTVI